MPTIYGMRLPEPSDWQEFEVITRDAMQLKWASPMLQRNGRAGQEQQGVDIYGLDQLGRPVAIQCKNTVKRLSLKKVEIEVKNADGYEGKLLALLHRHHRQNGRDASEGRSLTFREACQ